MTMKRRVKKLEKQVPAEVPKLLVDWGDGNAEDADMVVISWGKDEQIHVTQPRGRSDAT